MLGLADVRKGESCCGKSQLGPRNSKRSPLPCPGFLLHLPATLCLPAVCLHCARCCVLHEVPCETIGGDNCIECPRCKQLRSILLAPTNCVMPVWYAQLSAMHSEPLHLVRFCEMMHNSSVANFSTLQFLSVVFDSIHGVLFKCTEAEVLYNPYGCSAQSGCAMPVMWSCM